MRIGEFDSTSGRKLVLKKDDIFLFSRIRELENFSITLNIRIFIYAH